MSTTKRPIKTKDRATIIQALRAGVVPRSGLHHIQVGRSGELAQLNQDIDLIADGGSAIRLIIGEYGAGKTFFLNLVRMIAMEKQLLVVNADLAPDRRLHASGGQARNLFAELTRNMGTRTKADGGALASVVERFVSQAMKDADAQNISAESVIEQRLSPLEDLVSGYDFSKVITAYFIGATTGDDEKKSQALRWLRAEYTTRTEARKDLDVRTIIDDANIYDYLKLYSQFAKIAGYKGLLVVLDEMVNLYKLNSSQARSNNFEQILRILNDVLQGHAENIGFIMGGTPEFLMDTRRGLYSYEALQSRLAENTFAGEGVRDLSGSVIRLQNLTPEELYVLLHNIRNIFASGDPEKHLVSDEALHAFMDHCSKRIGSAYFQTPRTSIKAFVDLLSILEQHPDKHWNELISQIEVANDVMPSNDEVENDEGDELASFKL
ncbi:MAG: ATP-binding protein [Alphaproteobacteria bacterium CG11_big_fil_rev_8_21_14_0_20_39_49]|nr:MAG: ATP-binding protein [Alphaproteobacteria bacterium CG11_big_fil_rev_8_21_14_0_20_39_49]